MKSTARKVADTQYVPELVFVQMDVIAVIIETTVVNRVLNFVMLQCVINKTVFAHLVVHLKILLGPDVRIASMENGV